MGVAETRAKVQRILTEALGPVRVDADGDILLDFESAFGVVSVEDWGDGDTIVKVFSPMLRDVELTPEVFQWVSVEGQCKWFAHARILRGKENPNVGTIFWEYDILGNYLDAEELLHVVRAVMRGSNTLDDELQQRFGGKKALD